MNRDERLSRLEADRGITRKTFLTLLEQLAELNLRMLFIMEHFKYQKKVAGGLIIDGQARVETKTLYQLYAEGGRDDMLTLIEQRQQEIAAALATAMQEQTDAEGPSDAGAEVGAAQPGVEAAAEGSPARIIDFTGRTAEAGR